MKVAKPEAQAHKSCQTRKCSKVEKTKLKPKIAQLASQAYKNYDAVSVDFVPGVASSVAAFIAFAWVILLRVQRPIL